MRRLPKRQTDSRQLGLFEPVNRIKDMWLVQRAAYAHFFAYPLMLNNGSTIAWSGAQYPQYPAQCGVITGVGE